MAGREANTRVHARHRIGTQAPDRIFQVFNISNIVE